MAQSGHSKTHYFVDAVLECCTPRIAKMLELLPYNESYDAVSKTLILMRSNISCLSSGGTNGAEYAFKAGTTLGG